jgi:hypothetical protein
MKRKSRRLEVESLENRSLLASNVTVAVTNGTLSITGDYEKNYVTVEQAGPNAFRVLATEGTLINGSTDADQTFTGVTNDINIALKGGWDEVQIGSESAPGRIPRNLNVDCGDTRFDAVHLFAACGTSGRGGYAIIRSDRLYISASVPKNLVATRVNQLDARNLKVTGDLVISGTGGDDYYVLSVIQANNLKVDTWTGTDAIRLTEKPVILGDATIDTGEGNDGIALGSLSAYNLHINLAGGNDGLQSWGQSHIYHKATILGDEGIDKVLLDGFDVDEALYVWLYSEDDRLEVKNTSTPRAVFGGGPGTDALILGSGNAIGSIQQTGFEAG